MVYCIKLISIVIYMIGLDKSVVRLAAYIPGWARLFEQEKAALQRMLGRASLDIQHVGSTSIPGMLAKPIIDIAIAVADFEAARACIPKVESLGYVYRGEFGIPRRHYFRKGDPRTFHIHMCEEKSSSWQGMILFRDYLCQHPHVAQEYAVLKTQLALIYPQDREAYLEGKAGFIERVIQLARDEV